MFLKFFSKKSHKVTVVTCEILCVLTWIPLSKTIKKDKETVDGMQAGTRFRNEKELFKVEKWKSVIQQEISRDESYHTIKSAYNPTVSGEFLTVN